MMSLQDGSFQVFPNNVHFKILMYWGSAVGLWPIVFSKSLFWQKVYRIYSILIYLTGCAFTCCTLIQLLVLLTNKDKFIREIMGNLCLSTLHGMTLFRVYQLKSDKIKQLVQEALDMEKKIRKSSDSKIKKIYYYYANRSKFTNVIYLSSVVLAVLIYIIYPIYTGPVEKYFPTKNLTIQKRNLPMNTWLPFDDQKHYALAFLLVVTCGGLNAYYVIIADCFVFSLIIYPIGQIKILKNFFTNFDMYVNRVQKQIHCDRETACFVTFRECILIHKNIIRYINDFNEKMNVVMIFDFLQSSLQLASIVLQVLMTKMTPLSVILAGQFVFSMLTRLFIYYWNANEIVVESVGISKAVYDSCWYNQPESIKKMFIIVIRRCNKPSGLTIGHFKTMTLDTFISILRATYSYMTLFYK